MDIQYQRIIDQLNRIRLRARLQDEIRFPLFMTKESLTQKIIDDRRAQLGKNNKTAN